MNATVANRNALAASILVELNQVNTRLLRTEKYKAVADKTLLYRSFVLQNSIDILLRDNVDLTQDDFLYQKSISSIFGIEDVLVTDPLLTKIKNIL